MNISIDGGKTYASIDEVRISYDNLESDNGSRNLGFVFTSEGIVTDLVNVESGEVERTDSITVNEIVEMMVDESKA